MLWIHDYDNMKVLFKYAEWRLSRILPSIFQKNNSLKINDKLESIGKMTGLVSNEVEVAVDSLTKTCLSFSGCLLLIGVREQNGRDPQVGAGHVEAP